MKKLLSVFLCAAVLLIAQGPKRAPGFCLADSTGQWRDLADYRGKIVLVEFMQTNCPHCANFSTVLAGLAKNYGERLQILSIALTPDTPQTIMQYVAAHKQTWPRMVDM